jgi:hypothetical protein
MSRFCLTRRVVLVSCVTVVTVMLSACSGPVLNAQEREPAPNAPQTTTTSVPPALPVCPLPGATNSCLDGPAATAVVAQIQDGQVQAAQLAVSEQRYAMCFSDAGLYGALTGNVIPTTAPDWQSCPITGLTSAEAQQIQGLAIEFS